METFGAGSERLSRGSEAARNRGFETGFTPTVGGGEPDLT
jgi:hypothetical protein